MLKIQCCLIFTFSIYSLIAQNEPLQAYYDLIKARQELEHIDTDSEIASDRNSESDFTPVAEFPEPCGHRHYNPQVMTHRHQLQFEHRLKQLAEKTKFSEKARNNKAVQIPLVVHVIHQGEPVGSGENISEAQILSQIKALNDAFNRSDGTRYASLENNAGLNYSSLTEPAEIEFVLATVDPQGNSSNGINRVQAKKNYHLIPDFIDEIIKPATIWNPEYYMNIWSTRLTDGANPGLLGYAVFPTLSGLEGLDFYVNPNSDGIVCDYRTLGSNAYDEAFDLNPSYQFGVTAIHEVGHFLGLRHIWGDGESAEVGCTVDDFVDDTPNAAFRSSGCGSNESCQTIDLNENYMDYGSDQCKNLFTRGQIIRMHTVLENSPRRASLTTSPVLQGSPIPQEITPPNDLCSQAIPISCGQVITASTENSTAKDALTGLDGRICSGTGATTGIWYLLQGDGNTVTLKTSGKATDYDASIHVFAGPCDDLECVGGNDDGSSIFANTGSDLIFVAESNTAYFIYVSGKRGETGTFELSIACSNYNTSIAPVNDSYTQAIEINCGSLVSATSRSAYVDAIGSGTCGISISDKGLWYRYLGTGELVTVSTCSDLQFDTRIAIFSGKESFLECVAHNDNAQCDKGSTRKFIGLQDSTYFIWVGGEETGDFTLSLACEPAPEAPVDLLFTRQSEIDSFGLLYPTTTEILGNVTIQHDLNEHTIINNLTPLQNLTRIEGNLRIKDNVFDPFNQIDGLDNLVFVGGDLIIEGNPALKSIEGLASLEMVGGDLQISGFSIGKYESLNNLKSIGGSLILAGHRTQRGEIGNLPFDGLTDLGGDLNISGFIHVDTLDGFKLLEEIAGSVSIERNWSNVNKMGLKRLDGFPLLKSIKEDLIIYNNEGLEEIGILDKLERIGGDFQLEFNENLVDFAESFNQVKWIGGDFYSRFIGSPVFAGFNVLDTIQGKIKLQFLDLEDISIFDNLLHVGDSIVLNSALGSKPIYGAFPNLKSVNKSIYFNYLLDVPHFDGFHQIETIGEDLVLQRLTRCDSVIAFQNLSKVNGSIILELNIFNKYIGDFISLNSIGDNLLVVDNSNLERIAGLEKIKSIGGNVIFNLNNSLTELQLPQLSQIDGDISFNRNGDLEFISMPECTRIGNDFYLGRFNFSLDSMNFESLERIEGTFRSDSSSRTKLPGLKNLTTIGGDFIPSRSLFNFDFPNLQAVEGNMILDTMLFIRDLEGLESLEYIGSSLIINDMSRLTNLDGLATLGKIDETLQISDNPLLTSCSGICNVLNNIDNSMVFISGNGNGCNDLSALVEFCAVTPTVQYDHTGMITLAPNPFQHKIRISSENHIATKIEIFDLTGRLCRSMFLSPLNIHDLNLEELKSGIYLAKIFTNEGLVISKKLVKN